MTKGKVKPTSVRIPEKLLERIDTICNDDNCSRNDYIISILDEAVHNEVDEADDQEPKPIPKVIIDLNEPKPKPTLGTIKQFNDGKYRLTNIQDNGVQLWLKIEEIPELKNATVIWK